jgi:mono/diheme cytochrome c family protein
MPSAPSSTGRLTRRLSAGALAALLGALSVHAASAETPVERGQDLVLHNCSMCHAVGPTGASPNASAPLFRDLHARYPIDDLAEALAEGILTGHPQMPEFVFSPDDVTAIIDYLKSIQSRQGAARDAANPPPSGS